MPEETERLFAWGIGPPITAMVLGATYAGGIVFFVRVMLAKRWSDVALGFPSVIGFALTLGLVTLLHWDAFAHDHVAFWAWSGLYFTTPVLVLAVWVRNQRAASPASSSPKMPIRLRVLLAGIAVTLISVSLAFSVAPTSMQRCGCGR